MTIIAYTDGIDPVLNAAFSDFLTGLCGKVKPVPPSMTMSHFSRGDIDADLAAIDQRFKQGKLT